MDPQALIGFLIIAVALTCTPGPDWAYCIAAGLGRRSFVPAVAGLCSGYVMHTVLLAAGIAALMAAMPALLLWLTVAGALYLLWLGLVTARSWRGAGFSAAGPGTPGPDDGGTVALGPSGEIAAGSGARRAFLQGFGTSAINPKGLLFFVALTPQFIRPDAAFSIPVQSVVLGLSFVTAAAVVYSGVAAGARRLLRSRPGGARVVTLSSGIIMLGLGAVLLAEQAVPVTQAAGRLLAVI
ncbi:MULTISPECIES: LysE family translocator [unclassified Arthrobacter]|uniref:LysE family translocator n=1 Tax=unclassified Arthrobacter TaxID=235627 RepID=UPI00159DA6BD|nr:MULTISPECIES: LysE family translocator [unclassified Arthrobacter]MCQ9162480.1 LysE family translocator [Arthrobacter sp. STN4]NVM98306.1 LysE family translocator [Arthrobacter sp. SDTb3-6]